MNPRIDYMQQSPTLFKKLVELGTALGAGSIEQPLRHLVDIRASQINGCGFCLDMHIKQARMHGERELRLHHLSAWRESPLFSPRERAALAWTEVLTRLPDGGVPDEAYDAVRAELSEHEISDLTFAVTAINGWNRINVALRTVPGAFDAAFGLDKANLQ